MTLALEGVQTTLVPMTPDRRIVWEQVSTDHGVLYADPSCSRKVADAVVALSRTTDYSYGFAERLGAENLGMGKFGVALGIGRIAYKKAFQMNPPVGYFGLSALRANVALSAGLGAIPQLDEAVSRTVRGRSFEITTPQYFAAYVPHTQGQFGPTADHSTPTYAMSREDGIEPPGFADLPASVDRQRRYAEAISTFGLDPRYVNFDDSNENLLMRIEGDNAQLHLVKLDIATTHNTDYLYS